MQLGVAVLFEHCQVHTVGSCRTPRWAVLCRNKTVSACQDKVCYRLLKAPNRSGAQASPEGLLAHFRFPGPLAWTFRSGHEQRKNRELGGHTVGEAHFVLHLRYAHFPRLDDACLNHLHQEKAPSVQGLSKAPARLAAPRAIELFPPRLTTNMEPRPQCCACGRLWRFLAKNLNSAQLTLGGKHRSSNHAGCSLRDKCQHHFL